MTTIVLDTEFKTSTKEYYDEDTDTTKIRMDYSPFNPDSQLVSVHVATKSNDSWQAWSAFFHHSELPFEPETSRVQVQKALDECTLLVGHNIKIDLLWLWANGFAYSGPVYDTMNGEYVAARGQLKYALNLREAAERHGVTAKKDEVKHYFDQGITIDQVPLAIVDEYGCGDVITTGELYDSQQTWFNNPNNSGLIKTLALSNEFCRTLARMEYRGMRIDESALDSIEAELRAEREETLARVEETVRSVMGDTPINVGSTEQLAWVIFSRRPKDKPNWSRRFVRRDGSKAVPINRNMSDSAFKQLLRKDCELMYRTEMNQCPVCKGVGTVQKYKKDGTPYKMRNKCTTCSAKGYLYLSTGVVAGLKFNAPDATWISASGFSTSKENLEYLEAKAHETDNPLAAVFFRDVRRLSALDTYLNSFVKGIRKGVDTKWFLRCNFNQTRTATGRLSASDPNLQNMPRGTTFPVKRAFVSRFVGGYIADIDFAQLEFRAAGELSGCPVAAEDIRAGTDVHSVTAKTLSDAGQPTTRQQAKAKTFRPLYGGVSGTPAEVVYNKSFLEKYHGIKSWHERLQEEAINTKRIVTPTGREFAFDRVIRYGPGRSSHATKIKNYPVQSFATADIVPWAVILVDQALTGRGFRSMVINTVHDSLVIDVYPGEERDVMRVAVEAALSVVAKMQEFYGITLTLPYPVEASIGVNWLEQKGVYVCNKTTNEYGWVEGWR